MLGDVPNLNSPENSSALAAKGNQGHGSKMKKGRPWCEHCGRPGHTRETCWKIHGKPNDWKLAKYVAEKESCEDAIATDENKMTESIPFSKEQMETSEKMFKKITTQKHHSRLIGAQRQSHLHVHCKFQS